MQVTEMLDVGGGPSACVLLQIRAMLVVAETHPFGEESGAARLIVPVRR